MLLLILILDKFFTTPLLTQTKLWMRLIHRQREMLNSAVGKANLSTDQKGCQELVRTLEVCKSIVKKRTVTFAHQVRLLTLQISQMRAI